MNLRNAALLLLVSAPLVATTACIGPRHEPESAVFCPKCETVWVQRTDPEDPYRMDSVSVEKMRCPDCESAVVRFFETGELEHACSTCGGELVHCTSH